MSDLLAQKLKFAKRELTALKTAHRRGLGNLKVFEKNFTVPSQGHESGFWNMTLNINFDTTFSAYPFVYMVPSFVGSGSDTLAIQQVWTNYANGGYSAIIEAIYLRGDGSGDSYDIISTAPVVSVTYSWSQ